MFLSLYQLSLLNEELWFAIEDDDIDEYLGDHIQKNFEKIVVGVGQNHCLKSAITLRKR